MGVREDLEARYRAGRARLGAAPAPAKTVVMERPAAKPVVVKPVYVDVEAEIRKRQGLLQGCPLPARQKMLIADTLVETGVSWAQAVRHCCGLRHFEGNAERRRNLEVRKTIWKALHADGMSFSQIGKLCGFDHTSVHYALKPRGKLRD
jgi:hypothetical protein